MQPYQIRPFPFSLFPVSLPPASVFWSASVLPCFSCLFAELLCLEHPEQRTPLTTRNRVPERENREKEEASLLLPFRLFCPSSNVSIEKLASRVHDDWRSGSPWRQAATPTDENQGNQGNQGNHANQGGDVANRTALHLAFFSGSS